MGTVCCGIGENPKDDLRDRPTSRNANDIVKVSKNKKVLGSFTVFYCTPDGQIKGTMEVLANGLYFEPLICVENANYPILSKYEAQISWEDISSAQKKMMHNEKIPVNVKAAEKAKYMYEFFL